MKYHLYFLIALFLTSCAKQMDQPFQEKAPSIKPIPTRPIPILFGTCVASYEHFITLTGSDNLTINKIVLENNQVIQVEKKLVSITYHAQQRDEDFSLFRSQLNVLHTSYGMLQSNYTDVWTLGCKYASSGTPPFTNLSYKSRPIVLNTCFIWNIPPYGFDGIRIKYLVVD